MARYWAVFVFHMFWSLGWVRLGRWTWLHRWAGGPGYVVGQVDLIKYMQVALVRYAGGPGQMHIYSALGFVVLRF